MSPVDSRDGGRPTPRTIPGIHRSFRIGERTLVMGVVNVTPDSFSDGGRFLDPDQAVAHAARLVEDGADLIDVGGESTRPRATPVAPEEEWRRVAPVLARLRGELRVPVSIDTRHAWVAEQALAGGADLVNDVSGLRDPTMRSVVARTGAPAIMMHMRGDPITMQENVDYGDVVAEVVAALRDATDRARSEGVGAERLLVDPGLGFGKSVAGNYALLARLRELQSLGYPIVVGASRKSFLGAALGGLTTNDRLEAGIAAGVLAAWNGASILRTHDVRATVRALQLVDAVMRGP